MPQDIALPQFTAKCTINVVSIAINRYTAKIDR
jgi:hypothetical protein